jgi:hypothetical protein
LSPGSAPVPILVFVSAAAGAGWWRLLAALGGGAGGGAAFAFNPVRRLARSPATLLSYPILFLWFQQLSLVVAPQHQDFSFLSCLRAR